MSLQHADTIEPLSENTARIYVPARLVTDSAFPFDPGDPFVARTVRHEAVVLSPPDCTIDRIDLPPIRDDVLDVLDTTDTQTHEPQQQ